MCTANSWKSSAYSKIRTFTIRKEPLFHLSYLLCLWWFKKFNFADDDATYGGSTRCIYLVGLSALGSGGYKYPAPSSVKSVPSPAPAYCPATQHQHWQLWQLCPLRYIGPCTIHRELPRIFSSRTELAPGHFSLDMGYFSYVCLKLKKVVVLNWK